MFRVPNCLEMKMPGLYPGDAVGMAQSKLQCLLSAGCSLLGFFFLSFPHTPLGVTSVTHTSPRLSGWMMLQSAGDIRIPLALQTWASLWLSWLKVSWRAEKSWSEVWIFSIFMFEISCALIYHDWKLTLPALKSRVKSEVKKSAAFGLGSCEVMAFHGKEECEMAAARLTFYHVSLWVDFSFSFSIEPHSLIFGGGFYF